MPRHKFSNWKINFYRSATHVAGYPTAGGRSTSFISNFYLLFLVPQCIHWVVQIENELIYFKDGLVKGASFIDSFLRSSKRIICKLSMDSAEESSKRQQKITAANKNRRRVYNSLLLLKRPIEEGVRVMPIRGAKLRVRSGHPIGMPIQMQNDRNES